jgi:hypothetical protein
VAAPTVGSPADVVAITPREFSRRYGVARSRVYELIASGEIEARRNSERILIPVASAERWFHSLPPYEPVERPRRVSAGS